ncbi:MAG: hypothetical protein JNK74_14985 [Candidatus Hydrogenedentes bacterium]|nr:hypothetical protein [Candidatus Hydrogenedentota bacterium]
MDVIVERKVGNRELLLGLDYAYREAMKVFEAEKLLAAAEKVAGRLEIHPHDGPVEGYYGESPELTRYFQLVRALQDVPDTERHRVKDLVEFQRLREVTQSPLFGIPGDPSYLLPPSRDALYFALRSLPPNAWALSALTEAAAREAEARDDCSLVGLACRGRDAVCIAALRESVVLYAEPMCMMARSVRYRYQWEVEPSLAAAANRFIATVNALLSVSIPEAHKSNVEYYYHTSQNNMISGRCVRIGLDDRNRPVRHYHWAVNGDVGAYLVQDFWSDSLWTTEMYRQEKRIQQTVK